MRGAPGRAAIVMVVAMMATSAGCTGGDPGPAPSTTATSSPAPSTSTAPPTPEVPELPEAATRYDQPGAEAFVRHWFDLANYAQATGDTQPMRAAAEPECVVCEDMANQIDDARRTGESMEGGETVLSSVVAPTLNEDPEAALVSVRFQQVAGVIVSEDGTRTDVAADPAQNAGVVITFDGEWVVYGIGDL